jgi:predicted DNA-binding transcriptional regulator AlpA
MKQTATQSFNEGYISTQELCRRLGICRSTVYRLGLHDFTIPIGGVWRFKWADIVQHFENERRRMDTVSDTER